MNDDTALALPSFTIDSSITEWLAQKRTTRSGSPKTITAYGDTIQQYRDVLAGGGLDLLSNPIDIARIAPIWASTRLPARLRKDGTPNKRHQGDVSNSTYNQRLAILSSWYTFVQEVYKLDIPNPIKDVARRNVQAYAEVLPIEPDVIETGLESINRNHLQGLRNYALLAVALYTGRRASELVGLDGEDVQIMGKGKSARVLLRFHCKGGKVEYNKLDEETSVVFLEYLHPRDAQRVDSKRAAERKKRPLRREKQNTLSRSEVSFGMIPNPSIEVQTSAVERPSVPAWFAEVVILSQYLTTKGRISAFAHQVRLVRGRFGSYEPLDFLAVLIGSAISGKRTLSDFFQR